MLSTLRMEAGDVFLQFESQFDLTFAVFQTKSCLQVIGTPLRSMLQVMQTVRGWRSDPRGTPNLYRDIFCEPKCSEFRACRRTCCSSL